MALNLSHVSKHYDGKQVLQDVNLHIPQGEFLCVIGSSGCGKTTLLRILAGFESYQGTVTHNNVHVTEPSHQRFMVFQEFDQLLPWKTVYGNVAFGLQLQRADRYKGEVEQVIRQVGLQGFEDYYPHHLSGGMKQRAALARALIFHPSILLMDEPFGSVDAQMRRSLQGTLLDIWIRMKMTVIFVTHNIRESISLADRIALLNREGQVQRLVSVDLPRPRKPSHSKYTRIWGELLSDLGGEKF